MAVQHKQAKLAKHANKRKKSNDTSDNESDDNMSVQLIELPPSDHEAIKLVSRVKHVAKKHHLLQRQKWLQRISSRKRVPISANSSGCKTTESLTKTNLSKIWKTNPIIDGHL